MADQVQTPETAGGEGVAAAAAVQPVDEAKVDTPIGSPKVEPKIETKTEETPKQTPTETPQEIKSEEPKENKAEQPPEVQTEKPNEEPKEVKEEVSQALEQPLQTTEKAVENKETEAVNGAAAPNEQGDWQHRETELLKKIEELENVKKERTQDSLLLELKVREEEIDLLKARVKNLETELQAALSKPSGKNHEMIENIKQQHEELLSKARGMIFDKTKMVKNQELQIEALNTQIQSLKDINQITKDLLEIRNSEIKAMEDRLQAMEARFKVEKERYSLVLQRAQTSTNINGDLRKEYETQLQLFKELREKYDQRVQALVAENERLKGSLNSANGGAGTSG